MLAELFKGGVPSASYKDAILLATGTGMLAHLVYNRLEPRRISAHFILLVVLPIIPPILLQRSLWTLSHLVVVYITHHIVLIASLVLYRLSPFHPLARYPGPVLARTSMFWSVRMTMTGQRHLWLKRLHEQYGPYVRVGPNELSVVDAAAIQPVLGTEGMPKGPRLESRIVPGYPSNIISIREPHQHAERRKLWARAFTAESVRDYEPAVQRRALQLVEALERVSEKGHKVVDVATWIGCFTTDFMGDMAFGGGFETMASYDEEDLRGGMQRSMIAGTIVENIPWIGPFLFHLGFLNAVVKFRQFSTHRAKLRIERGPSGKRDLFHYLIDEDGISPHPPSLAQAIADAAIAIVAGSDTTSSAMGCTVYLLLRHPDVHKRLQAEIDAVFPPGEGDPFDSNKLAQMPYLNAVINEVLRLFPAAPTGSQRAPLRGSGGKAVGSHFIPEGTSVYIPTYVLHRDPQYFSPYPEVFWPERWLGVESDDSKTNTKRSHKNEEGTQSEKFTTTTAAYIPFSFGPANCAGKRLAILEMRMVLSLLVQRFEIKPAPGYDLQQFEEDVRDWFAMQVGKLPVLLSPRA